MITQYDLNLFFVFFRPFRLLTNLSTSFLIDGRGHIQKQIRSENFQLMLQDELEGRTAILFPDVIFRSTPRTPRNRNINLSFIVKLLSS